MRKEGNGTSASQKALTNTAYPLRTPGGERTGSKGARAMGSSPKSGKKKTREKKTLQILKKRKAGEFSSSFKKGTKERGRGKKVMSGSSLERLI